MKQLNAESLSPSSLRVPRALVLSLARLVTAWVVLCWWTGLAGAHGDQHERIERLTQQIAHHPRDAQLYLQRGILHRQHYEWKAAEKDLNRAIALKPTLTTVELERGKLFLSTHRASEAKLALDRFLRAQPNHAEALLTRARTLAQLHQPVAAAADFTRVLALVPEPTPDAYVERAQALTAAGPAHAMEALRGLDEGIARLGPLVTLQLQAIEIALTVKHYDNALRRLERVAAQTQRKEAWLVRRAEILEQAGRVAEARAAWTEALAAIDALPPKHRKNLTTGALAARIRERLTWLTGQQNDVVHSRDATE